MEYITDRVKVDENGCWIWQKSRNKDGYGQAHFQGKSLLAHRLAFYLKNGYMATVTCHTCINGGMRGCTNPNHLYDGSTGSNIQDRIKQGTSRKYSVLTKEDVLLSLKLKDQGKTSREIAKILGVGKSTILRIFRGKCWSDVTGINKTVLKVTRSVPNRLVMEDYH